MNARRSPVTNANVDRTRMLQACGGVCCTSDIVFPLLFVTRRSAVAAPRPWGEEMHS